MTATLEDAILGETLSDEATLGMAKSLRKYREGRYETVGEFAKFLGISVDTYWRTIKRETRPHPATMRKIAKKLKVKPQDISEFIIPDDVETDDEAH